MSDDISMRALKFSLKENTIKAFTAGCNLVLHCNGNLKEMTIVAKNSPPINDFIRKKNANLNKLFI
jgi:Beta-glucosidase-related glycosidases